jgi:hypothetical protein
MAVDLRVPAGSPPINKASTLTKSAGGTIVTGIDIALKAIGADPGSLP